MTATATEVMMEIRLMIVIMIELCQSELMVAKKKHRKAARNAKKKTKKKKGMVAMAMTTTRMRTMR
jgi:hypothetical protein